MNQQNLRSLQAVFRRYPQIWAVYLSGSQAEGRAGQGSDVDLGIVLTFGILRVGVGTTLPLTEESARAILQIVRGGQREGVEIRS